MAASAYREEFDTFIQESSEKINAAIQNVTETEEEFNSLIAAVKESKEELQNYLTSLNDKTDEIDALYARIFKGSEDENPLKESIDESYSKIEEILKAAQSQSVVLFGGKKSKRGQEVSSVSISAANKDKYIFSEGKYYEKIQEDDPGLIKKTEAKIAALDVEIKKINERILVFFEQKKNETESLKQELESLLPDATTAGLASAYNRAERVQTNNIYIWGGVFLASIIAMAFFVLYLRQVSIAGASLWETILRNLLYILPVEIPLVWLAGFSSKKISQHLRLHEEYLHKWTVATTFSGMLRMLENETPDDSDYSADESLQQTALQDLYTSAIRSFTKNPSDTLDKKVFSGNPVEKLLNKGTDFVGGLMGKTISKTSQDKTD